MARLQSSALSLLALRCPRCHEGKLFSHSPFNPAKFAAMPSHCPVCGQAYEPEPGFYWGAMFISYGFNTAVFALVGLGLFYLAGDPPVWVYVAGVAGTSLLLTPFIFRYSRALMLYLFGFIAHQPDWRSNPAPLRRTHHREGAVAVE